MVNLIKGNITSIDGNDTIATRVVVATSAPHPNLDDGSARLDDPQNTGNGRFENGAITIGSGLQASRTTALRGNGVDFVEKTAGNGIEIPFTIRKTGVQGQVSGRAWRLDAGTQTFSVTVTQGTLSSVYDGGRLTVAGVAMTIERVDATAQTVTVTQLVDIPFELVDDDAATHPFTVDMLLMQESDNPNLNLFAPAHSRPVYDLGTGHLHHRS